MAKITLEILGQHIQSIASGYSKQILELEDAAFLADDVQAIRIQLEQLQHQMRLEQLEPLRVKHPVHIAWFTIDELPKPLIGRIQNAIEVLRLLLPQPQGHAGFYLEVLHRPEMVCEYRFVKPDFSEIYLRSDAPTNVIVHELGHWLEASIPGAEKAAFAHLLPRVQNEEPRHLGPGYHALEYTQPDAFIHPYTGKCKADGSRVYTELISIGLEYLYQDPMLLIEQDPQTTVFLFNLLESV